MNPSLYLETTVIGHLTSWPSPLVQTVAMQQTTREWWDNHRHQYELFVSQFVVNERAAGDAEAAKERLEQIDGIPLHPSRINGESVMSSTPIIDEIKRYREQQAAKFNYDLRAIVADAQQRQTQDGRVVVRREPRTPQLPTTHNKSGG